MVFLFSSRLHQKVQQITVRIFFHLFDGPKLKIRYEIYPPLLNLRVNVIIELILAMNCIFLLKDYVRMFLFDK